MTIIFILSLLPQDQFPKAPFSFLDLVVHFTMYSGLAYCLSLSLFDYILENKITYLEFKIPSTLGLIGLFIEYLQKTLPINRFFSWEDALFNFIGACSFYFIVLKLRNKSS